MANDRIQGLADICRQLRREFEELRASLEQRLAVLENPRKPDEWWTPKAMAVECNCTGDHEKLQALKFLARQYSKANNLEIRKGDGPKAHEYFHPEAARYAIAQVKGD